MVDNDIRPARPRIVYIDIETDSRVPFSKKEEMRILSWVTVDENGNTESALLKSDTDNSECNLLKKMWSVLDNYDLVIAWNGDRFDFPVMQARSIHTGISQDPNWQWKRWLWLDHLEIFRRMNTMVAESGEEKQSFALENIAQAILGEGKDDFDSSKTWESWIAGGKERRRLLKYNEKDTKLLKMIEDKTGYIELLLTLGDACGTFSSTRGASPTVQVESFFQRLAASIDYKFPTVLKYGKDKGDQYKGAFVMEPTGVGIVKNVHVADFSSLYPSIIKTWNMSPETIVRKEYETIPEYWCYSPLTKIYFDQENQGILPKAIDELLRLRKEWNKKKSQATPGMDEWKDADRRSTAYKIAANSFYGVIGTPVSRFFDRDVAESVTQCGAWLIKKTIESAEDHGMDVIYGDTDSIFVSNATRDEFESFVEYCNTDMYPRILYEMNCIENNINLAYEKEFERIVFTAAKKYAGRYAHYKGTVATEESKPEIKGLEYKRGDSIRLARDLQSQVVDMLVGPKNGGIEDPDLYEDLLDKWMRRVIYDPVDLEDIVISKRLSKDVDKYNRKLKKDGTFARQLPHIEMARLLKKRGRDVNEGAKIDYVIVDGSTSPKTVIPAEDWTGETNRYPIWDHLVYPPTYRLLTAAFPHIKWSEWSKSEKALK
jgi:DNA polymerase elongation subunit (family B)